MARLRTPRKKAQQTLIHELSDKELRDLLARTRREIETLPEQPSPADIQRGEAAHEQRRAVENELGRRGRSGRRREPSAASKAVRALEHSWPPELKGEAVDASRLSRDQGEELLVLAEKRKEGEELSAAELARFEHLAGLAAGNEKLFEQKRNEATAHAKKNELEEKIRVASLPRRVEWAEVGSITLPRFLFEWLETSRDESWTVADLGMLAAMLFQFENRVSLFPNARFEEENGEAVLVVQSVEGLRFPPSRNSSSPAFDTSGYVRERVALTTLARNKWLEIDRSRGDLRVKLGERAMKLREGKERGKTA